VPDVEAATIPGLSEGVEAEENTVEAVLHAAVTRTINCCTIVLRYFTLAS